MDSVSQRFLEELRQSIVDSNEDIGMVGDHSVQSATCALCQRTFSPENVATGDLETISMCGDCKFLYLEDHGGPTHDSYQGTPSTRRRARNSSSESLDNIFSQQFSHMINLMRQNQSPGSGLEDFPADGDPAARVSQRTSSRTTPSGSRRWRRVLSDTESDGYDNGDSLYGENESNLSFGRYRAFHGESDAISFSAYGGDSDASVDLHGFLDTETIIQPDDGSAFDSDTDIDPMHAGLDQWNSDDTEEEEEEEDDDDEAHKLFNICDALESLENQLSSLQALQQQQRYEREVALSEMESSRKMLLNKLKEYKGNDLEVIHEASAFAGETVEHNNDLLLPPYPSRSPHTFCLENGYLPPTHKSLRNGIINSDPTNEEKKKLSETDRDEVKTGSKNSRGLGFVLSTAAKTVLTIVGVASVLSLSGFGPRFVRSNTTFKISGLSQQPLSKEKRSTIECPPGRVLVVEDGKARCVVKERVEVPFSSAVARPDVNYGCG